VLASVEVAIKEPTSTKKSPASTIDLVLFAGDSVLTVQTIAFVEVPISLL
jgi:hypothetical protein